MDVRSRDDYFAELQALLPPGLAWPRDPDAVLSHLLYAWTAELARHDARAAQLLEEADPSTCDGLLPEWEVWVGLPSPCTSGESLSTNDRRAAVVQKLTDVGGQTVQDYIDLCARFGITVTVDEFDARTCMSDCMTPNYDHAWRFAWRINIPGSYSPAYFDCMTTIDRPLAWWGNRLLECIIRQRAQAHTIVLFAYPES